MGTRAKREGVPVFIRIPKAVDKMLRAAVKEQRKAKRAPGVKPWTLKDEILARLSVTL